MKLLCSVLDFPSEINQLFNPARGQSHTLVHFITLLSRNTRAYFFHVVSSTSVTTSLCSTESRQRLTLTLLCPFWSHSKTARMHLGPGPKCLGKESSIVFFHPAAYFCLFVLHFLIVFCKDCKNNKCSSKHCRCWDWEVRPVYRLLQLHCEYKQLPVVFRPVSLSGK